LRLRTLVGVWAYLVSALFVITIRVISPGTSSYSKAGACLYLLPGHRMELLQYNERKSVWQFKLYYSKEARHFD